MARTCWIILCFIALLAAGRYCRVWEPVQKFVIQTQPGLYKVITDIDGDTIVVNMNGVNEKVRLIGVDTPETHDPRKPVQCYGPTAAAFTKQNVEGKVVRLEADSLSTNRDRYNRLLRYVYLQDGTFLNKQLILQGYGFAYTGFPFSHKHDFMRAEQQAQGQLKGLWGICHPSQNQYGGYTSNEAQQN